MCNTVSALLGDGQNLCCTTDFEVERPGSLLIEPFKFEKHPSIGFEKRHYMLVKKKNFMFYFKFKKKSFTRLEV